MKKFIMGLFLAVIVSSTAFAAMNLRQKSNSGAEWRHSPSGHTYNIARQYVQFRITDLSTAASETAFVIHPGVITEIRCTQNAAITGSPAVVTLAVQNSAGAASEASITSLNFAVGGSGLGILREVTGLTQSVSAGAVIEVGTDGSSTGTSSASCFVVIDTNS